MQIEFDNNESGFWEARAVHAMAEQFIDKVSRSGDRQLLEFLREASLEHLNREHYDELRETVGLTDPHWPRTSLIEQFRRWALGPTHEEAELSAQRREAEEREAHAEFSALEAMAEARHLKLERDALTAEVTRLRAELARLTPPLSQGE